MTTAETPKKNIVVIGGGPAGVGVAQGLSNALDASKFSIQLVTERSFFVHWPAMIRVIVTAQGDFENKTLNPYDKVFKPNRPGEIVIGSVTRVEDGVVHLADGKTTLPYDWLVLATGTKRDGALNLPTDRAEATKWIADWQERFAKAKQVVVVGGGAVGIEVSGEIRHFHPETHITIVHSDEELIHEPYPTKFRSALNRAVRAKRIDLVLGDRAIVPDSSESYTSIKTEKGVEIPADLVVPLRGGTINTAFLSSFDSTILTPSGTVKIHPTFQVQLANGKTNVYAVGDIIDWKEQKQLSKVPGHVGVAVANILADINGKPVTKKYGGGIEALCVPLGPNSGVMWVPMMWGMIFGDWATSTLKGKSLFCWMARGMLNLS